MKTKKTIHAALFAALTCVATMVIKLPTPTMGYIHPGDAVVLLSGFLLGPLYGGLAAGIGSMFADLFSGYLLYAPATFFIKFFTAVIACCLARQSKKIFHQLPATILSGFLGETFMVIGYFVFEIFALAFSTGSGLTASNLTSGIISAAGGIPFNVVQGIFGVTISAILYPILKKIFYQSEGE